MKPVLRAVRRAGLGLATIAALTATPLKAMAQSAPTPTPPALPADAPPITGMDGSAVVQELLVIGRRPGPALWRVTRGDSEVVIVGGLSPLPHSLQWDTIRVEHALEDSTVLFLSPNKAHVGVFDAASMFMRQGALKPAHGADMETTLPPALRARFIRVRDSFHGDPKHYQHWKPALAGLFLVGDFHRAAGLSDDKPGTTIAKLARAANAEVRTVGAVNVKPLFDAAANMSDAQNQACLSAALDDIERESARARPAAAAWAVGDLRGVRENSSASLVDGCLLQLPGVQNIVESGTRDAVQTIHAALNRPGRSVAVIDLTFLLRKNGVLDRLKVEGDQITVPLD